MIGNSLMNKNKITREIINKFIPKEKVNKMI